MLQELSASSGTTVWAVGSMLFFLVVYVVVAFRAFTTASTELDARARLPLDDEGNSTSDEPCQARPRGSHKVRVTAG